MRHNHLALSGELRNFTALIFMAFLLKFTSFVVKIPRVKFCGLRQT
jgi:hypothetical protein